MQHDLITKAIEEDSAELKECDEYYPMIAVQPVKVIEDIEHRNYGRHIHLKGPCSPLDTQVHSVLLDSDQKAITIDAHSVNSVFLTSMQQVRFRMILIE